MSTITLIRKKFGLRQEEIAQWLGISRSQVANYERHERSLRREASMQLTRLEIVFANMETNKGRSNTITLSPERKTLVQQQYKWQIGDCEYKAAMMSRRLAAMQKKHAQLLTRVEMLEILMMEATEKKEKNNLSWLKSQLARTKRSLNTCDEVPQLKLKMNIRMLENGSKIKINEI